MKISPQFAGSKFWTRCFVAAFCFALFPTISSFAVERFQLTTETFQTQEDGQITRYLLFTETNKFSLMAPRVDWTAETSAADKTVNFISPERSVTVAIQIAETNSTPQPDTLMESLRQKALAHFPTSHVVKEFISYTGTGPAQTFELQWKTGTTPFSGRMTFVSFNGGTINFSMATTADDFKKNESSYACTLASLRVETVKAKN